MSSPSPSKPSSSDGKLPEEAVMAGFHLFIVNGLAQAKFEGLLDEDSLASADADVMVCGPALCLYFAALRSSTTPPSVPIPRSSLASSPTPTTPPSPSVAVLNAHTCPPVFLPFFKLWAQTVPDIQRLSEEHKHDLARIICDKPPLSWDPSTQSSSSNANGPPSLNRLAADLKSVAIEITQRRTFQERYRQDLQSALDVGQADLGEKRRRLANFAPPPKYDDIARAQASLREQETSNPELPTDSSGTSNLAAEGNVYGGPADPSTTVGSPRRRPIPSPPPTGTGIGSPPRLTTSLSPETLNRSLPSPPTSALEGPDTSIDPATSIGNSMLQPVRAGAMRGESDGSIMRAVVGAGNLGSLGALNSGSPPNSGGIQSPSTNAVSPSVKGNTPVGAMNSPPSSRQSLESQYLSPSSATSSRTEGAGTSSSRRSPGPTLHPPEGPAINLIRETLYAALAEVLALNPSIKQLLVTDPPRAYFSSVSLSILTVSTHCLTPSREGIMTPLGRILMLPICPPEYQPFMREILGIGSTLKDWEVEDTTGRDLARTEGRQPEEPRKDRLKRMLLVGVAVEEERSQSSPAVQAGPTGGSTTNRARYQAPASPPPPPAVKSTISTPPPVRRSIEQDLAPPPSVGGSSRSSSLTPSPRSSFEGRRSAEHQPHTILSIPKEDKGRRGSSGSSNSEKSGAHRVLRKRRPPPPSEQPDPGIGGDITIKVPVMSKGDSSGRIGNIPSPHRPGSAGKGSRGDRFSPPPSMPVPDTSAHLNPAIPSLSIGTHETPSYADIAPPRRSLEGTTIQMANRINALSLRLTSLRMFQERQDMVFKILASVTD